MDAVVIGFCISTVFVNIVLTLTCLYVNRATVSDATTATKEKLSIPRYRVHAKKTPTHYRSEQDQASAWETKQERGGWGSPDA